MRKNFVIVLAVALIMALALPAMAITNGGAPDDGEHPYVGLSIYGFDTPQGFAPAWRCSGTLVAPQVYVTAGHCTYEADKAVIWFEELEGDILDGGYPFPGGTGVTGTPYTHPEYPNASFILHDFGIVILDEPYHMDEYGTMPDPNALGDYIDEVGKGRKGATLTAVGYGVNRINPVQFESTRSRLQADLMVVNTRGLLGLGNTQFADQFVIVSGDAKHGGTCFGDSGGPQFIEGTTTIAAVTSFGLNGNCAGIGGSYRIDQADDLAWYDHIVTTYLP